MVKDTKLFPYILNKDCMFREAFNQTCIFRALHTEQYFCKQRSYRLSTAKI